MARCGASGAAAEIAEKFLVRREDARDSRRVGSGGPDIALEAAAKDNAAGPREQNAPFARNGVAHVGLRTEDGKLAADRDHAFVPEQRARADAGAVEYQRFG